ncbi:DUF1818 family protein [Prochlorococcus marinus]|uniref:DUF1818 domain-containing protein n=1 Tax=Prochlorococcus marinus (strain MIT 9211) TaxID=93059 RepID=A9BCB7_PROM4|nr:DUF1818 family protein [Prochlorococcus marinus]ABX09479.1 conserved hypothetical protein [Prochlorococcus marinus str. MIT 9211]
MIEHEGPGWRLAWDPSKKNYPFLIGGENWAFEVSEREWKILVQIINELIDQHQSLKNQLMPEESISLELERTPCWACIEGNKNSWSLKLILEGDDSDGYQSRSVEMYWPIPIAQMITAGLRKMWDSG